MNLLDIFKRLASKRQYAAGLQGNHWAPNLRGKTKHNRHHNTGQNRDRENARRRRQMMRDTT